VIKKVGSIVENPFHHVERLAGYKLFKLRIGDYRAVFDIKETEIVVVLVGSRDKVYQTLHRRVS
jgi:mRNA-degrading endonuclease RelE of RelBE toxin-antitoxin system